MCKSIVKGAIFGGIILFVWYMISWMALPWHKSTMNVFKNSSEVEAFMMKETPKSGIYVLPCHEGKKGDTAKKSSPSLFVSMNKEGVVRYCNSLYHWTDHSDCCSCSCLMDAVLCKETELFL